MTSLSLQAHRRYDARFCFECGHPPGHDRDHVLISATHVPPRRAATSRRRQATVVPQAYAARADEPSLCTNVMGCTAPDAQFVIGGAHFVCVIGVSR